MQDLTSIVQQLAQTQTRTQQQLDQTVTIVNEASAIARSNARSVQAWEALISQNRDGAEEERSALAVRLTDLEQASRENIQQHFAFRQEHTDFIQRFDATQAEIRRIWERIENQ